MNLSTIFNNHRPHASLIRAVLLALTVTLLAVSCGSTKVVTANKTMVYRDAIYNVSSVDVFKRSTEATGADGGSVNLDDISKSGFRTLVDEHGKLSVRQAFQLDEVEVVYQAMQVDSWSDYSRMSKRFDNAAEDLQKFLADKKKTQLKLK